MLLELLLEKAAVFSLFCHFTLGFLLPCPVCLPLYWQLAEGHSELMCAPIAPSYPANN